jgi:serine acetyltransferase
MNKIFLFGGGAFGRETKLLIEESQNYEFAAFVDNFSDHNEKTISEEIFFSNAFIKDNILYGCNHSNINCECNKKPISIALTIANPKNRELIFEKIRFNLNLNSEFNHIYFPTLIHHTSKIAGLHVNNTGAVSLGYGSIIYANCVLTDNIKMGNFTQLHMFTSIGHDFQGKSGNYFTTAPGVHIGGWNVIGNRIYCGANSGTKEKLSICDDVLLGGGAFLVNDIFDSGVYVGIPAKKLK